MIIDKDQANHENPLWLITSFIANPESQIMPPLRFVSLHPILLLMILVAPAKAGNILRLMPGDEFGAVVVGDAPFYEYQGVVGEGGRVTEVTAYGHSTVDLPASTRAQGLSVYDYSTATTSSGYDYLIAHGHGSITVMNSGSADVVAYDDSVLRFINAGANIYLNDRSTLYVEGTTAPQLIVTMGSSRVHLQSGNVLDLVYSSHDDLVQDLDEFVSASIDSVGVKDNSNILFSGKSSVGRFYARDTSSLGLYGLVASSDMIVSSEGSHPVTIAQSKFGSLYLHGERDVIIDSSIVGILDNYGVGTVYFRGGQTAILGNSNGTVYWSGGVAREVFGNSGLIRVFGSDLKIENGMLSGRLTDGTTLVDVPVHLGASGRIELVEASSVPEPATVVGVLVAALVQVARLRRSKRCGMERPGPG